MWREQRHHAGLSSIDPLLAVPREETHDCCRCCHHWKEGERTSWPTYLGRPHSKRGKHQRKKERNETADLE
ncbi:unnamed protein product [Spirodela intermedia]|uniref:Uncharacterized protein n=1 Tax=Spirodela intermedia TaxID=51605 RepID=A0A7I8KV34_SPIIN|nr:unnamed protein product [Spirodela intermedia]